jgi:hypothetical protein
MMFASAAFAAPLPSNLFTANCLSKDGLEIAEVTYAIIYGTTAPTGISINTDTLAANLACNAMVTACAGLSEIDGSVVKASVKQTTANVYEFDFDHLTLTCPLPM